MGKRFIRVRRGIIRRLGFVLSVSAVLATAAYASLPVWFPVHWFVARLERQLSHDLGLPVRLGGMEIGWIRGVVLTDLQIGESDADSPRAHIERLHCALTPLRILFTQRVVELEIDRPELFIHAGGEGKLSWNALGDTSESGGLPSFNYVLRELACHVKTPRGTETIRMDRLECRLDSASGSLRLRGEVRVDPQSEDPVTSKLRRLNVTAHALLPRLNSAVKLRGDMHIEWTSLTLTDLPLRLVPELPLEQVAGTTSGSLDLQAQPDLGIDYGVQVALDGVRLRDADSPRSATIPDALLSCAGHWDPAGDLVELQDFDVRTPGLRLIGVRAASRPALRLDLGERNPAEMHVSGTVKDWQRCQEEWPPLAKVLHKYGADLEGSASFQADVTRRFGLDYLLLKLDMGPTACRVMGEGEAPWIDAPSGVPKAIETELTLKQKENIRADGRLSLAYGSTSLSLEGASRAPLDWLEADGPSGWKRIEPWVRNAAAEMSWKCEDIAGCLGSVPVLQRHLDGWGGVHIAGPGKAELRVKPTPVGSGVRLAVELSQGAELAVRDVVVKKADRSLAVYLETAVPLLREATLQDWRLSIGYGDAQIDLGGPGSELSYRGGELVTSVESVLAHGPGVLEEMRLTARVAARRVEDWVELLPRVAAQLAGLKPGRLTGDFSSILSCSLSRRPDDLLLVTALDLNGTGLGAQLGDFFFKQAGEPLHGVVSHRLTERGAAEHLLQATITGGGGSLEAGGAVTLNDRGDWEAYRGGWLHAAITDITAAAKLCPRYQSRLADLDVSGGLELHVKAVSTAQKQESLDHMLLDVEVDATDLGARMPTLPVVVKQRDLPLTLKLHGAVDTPESDGGSVVQLTSGLLKCGDTVVDTLQGSMKLDRSITACRPRGMGDGAAPRVVAGSVELVADVRLGKVFRSLNSELAQWCDHVQLGGEAPVRVRTSWDEQGWRCAGQMDGRQVSFDVPTAWQSVPRVGKRAGSPVKLEFQAEGKANPAVGRQSMELKKLQLVLAEDELTAAGSLSFARHGDQWSAEAFGLQTKLHLPRPEALLDWLPGSLVDRLAGRADITMDLAKNGGALRWGPVHADFKDFSAVFNGEAVGLDGHLVLAMDSLMLDPLLVKWGPSDVTLSGSLRRDAQGQGGRLVVSSRSVNVSQLMDAARQTTRRWGLAQEAAEPATDTAWLSKLIPELARTELRVDAYADTLQVVLPPEQSVQADALVASLQVDKGPVTFTFNALAGGGSVSGKVTSQTQAAAPTYHLEYTADNVQAGPLLEGYLRQTFPGMTATGGLTLIDETTQKLFPAPGEPNGDVGKGELIIHGGYMVGRATPTWVVNIFPGLNLSRYDFTYLHSWFEKFPTGRVRHQMIYQGTYYNVYMIGHNDPDRSFEYEVGIDFLADFDSKYWAESGQGRIPLFVKTGKVAADGSLAEEEVNFASPQRTLETWLLNNNPAITVYHAVRKRILGEP